MVGDLFLDDSFFLQSTNSLSREVHGDFLAINHEGFLLQVRFEDSLGAAQRKADVIAMHFAFTSDLTSCHIIYFLQSICTILLFFSILVKG